MNLVVLRGYKFVEFGALNDTFIEALALDRPLKAIYTTSATTTITPK
jgi:hypothetical protein